MNSEKEIFQRTERLVGKDTMNRISSARVILFGVGGVGSWCAESLIRSGIKHLTIVDSDEVHISNVNRQLMATIKTIGLAKVDVLKDRLMDINPLADITAIKGIYSAETSDSFQLDRFDYIIDAIDSLENKIHLIRTATRTKATFFSSMGAALKMDSTRIDVAEFWKVKGCPLAAAIRRRIKKGELPAKKFLCVYSDEVMENKGEILIPDANNNQPSSQWDSKKAQINGTVSHITAIFGFTLAGLVIKDIYEQND
jgi:tRNA A37 threonylcarbamoyladenosine dehydratase